jgi:hypothetical protein
MGNFFPFFYSVLHSFSKKEYVCLLAGILDEKFFGMMEMGVVC